MHVWYFEILDEILVFFGPVANDYLKKKLSYFLSSEWMIETTKVKVERVLKCGCLQCVSLLLWWAFILLTFLLVYLYQCNVSEYAVWSDHKLSDLWISWWIQMYINRMAGSLCKDQSIYKELLWFFFFNNILKYMDIYDTPGTCITNCSQVKSPFSLIYTYFTHAWKLFCLLLLYWITILLLSDFKTFVCYIDSVVYTALMAHCCNFRHFVCSNLPV